jgi:hypothetical protein
VIIPEKPNDGLEWTMYLFVLKESWRRRKFGILGIIIHDHD